MRATVTSEEESAEERKDRSSSRSEDTLGELADFLLDNPWLNQALQLALGARERASQAGAQAMRNVGAPGGFERSPSGSSRSRTSSTCSATRWRSSAASCARRPSPRASYSSESAPEAHVPIRSTAPASA